MQQSRVAVYTPSTAALFSGGNAADLCAVTDVTSELNIDSSSNTWLASVITRVSTAMQTYCNRVIRPQYVWDRVWPGRGVWPRIVEERDAPLKMAGWPIIGVANATGIAPPAPPTLVSVAGGSLAARTLFVRISYSSPFGETAASLESSVSLAANTLLQVSPPAQDGGAQATGWNVYVSAATTTETLQTSSPLTFAQTWSEPGTGFVVGSVVPQASPSIAEVCAAVTPLAEGVDFVVDYARGQVTRLGSDGHATQWAPNEVRMLYQSGYATIPSDLQDAAIRSVAARYYARNRDPQLRQQNVVGIMETTYWFGSGPGADIDFPPDIVAKLDRYRVPTTA